jgi:hypothetical protein
VAAVAAVLVHLVVEILVLAAEVALLYLWVGLHQQLLLLLEQVVQVPPLAVQQPLVPFLVQVVAEVLMLVRRMLVLE